MKGNKNGKSSVQNGSQHTFSKEENEMNETMSAQEKKMRTAMIVAAVSTVSFVIAVILDKTTHGDGVTLIPLLTAWILSPVSLIVSGRALRGLAITWSPFKWVLTKVLFPFNLLFLLSIAPAITAILFLVPGIVIFIMMREQKQAAEEAAQ